MWTPKSHAEIYPFIVHFLFAVIIATSYETAILVFINPERAFSFNFESLIPGLELLLAYAAIISGWVGYSRSMIKWPHQNTKSGVSRFVLDLAILFCYFGLIVLADPQNNTFKENFVSWLVAMFVLFFIWDLAKIIEYRKPHVSKALWRSLLKTIIFLILITMTYMLFPTVSKLLGWIEKSDATLTSDNIVYGVFLIVITALMILYRYWKWSIHQRKESFDSTT